MDPDGKFVFRLVHRKKEDGMKVLLKSKYLVIVIAALLAISLLPAVPARTLAAEGDQPLDFVTDTSSRSGKGWSWDKDTATLKLSGLNLNLALPKYEKDYKAAILLPDAAALGAEQITVVLEGDSTIGLTGKTADGDYRLAVFTPGNLVLTGSGALSIDGDQEANGIEADGSLFVGQGTDSVDGTKIAVSNALDFALASEKALTINGASVKADIAGTSEDPNAAKYALIGENEDAAKYGVYISNADIEVSTGGKGSAGIMGYDQTVRLSGVTFKQEAPDSATGVYGIAAYNGDVIIDNSGLEIDLGTIDSGKDQQDVLISAGKDFSSSAPAENPAILIDKSTVSGLVPGEGLSAMFGGVTVSESDVAVTAKGHAVFAGSGGVSVADSKAVLCNEANYYSDAVSSAGPVSISNSKVNLEGNGEMATALSIGQVTSDALTVSGRETIVDMRGTYMALALSMDPVTIEAPVTLKDGLGAVVGGTMQYVDTNPLDIPTRTFTYSESTLEAEDNQIKNASTSVVLANPDDILVLKQPQSQVVSYPEGAQFRVEVLHPELVESYQWICTDIAGNEFVLQGTSAKTDTLTIPSTDPLDMLLTYRCEITGKDGSKVVSNNATLDLDNRHDAKTVLYVREYALEKGGTLDLSSKDLGTGTISLSEDASEVTMDQVAFDNSSLPVYDYYLSPSAGIMLDTHHNDKETIRIHLIGKNSVNNTFTDPSGNGIGLILTAREASVVPQFVFDGSCSDPGGEEGTLTVIGGTRAISADGGNVVLDADVKIERCRVEGHEYDFEDGIVCDAATVKEGRSIDLNVNGAGFSVINGLTIEKKANVEIDTIAPKINGNGLGTYKGSVFMGRTSANAGAPGQTEDPLNQKAVWFTGWGASEMDGAPAQVNGVLTYKAGIFAGGGIVKLDPESSLFVLCGAKPEAGAEIGGFAGIMLQNGATLVAEDNMIGISMYADPDPQGLPYAANFSGINGGDGGNITLNKMLLDMNVVSPNIHGAMGIYTNGSVSIADSDIHIKGRSVGQVFGLAPEDSLTVNNSLVTVWTESLDKDGASYAVCAGGLEASFDRQEGYILAASQNDNGAAFLVKTGETGETPKGYDPDYKSRRILLKGMAGISFPEKNAVSLTSMKGSVSSYLYLETVYDKDNTSKPAQMAWISPQIDLDATVELEGTSFTYTGLEITPAVKSVVMDGKTLDPEEDYDVSYENNINAGTASVIVTGKGDYRGSVTKNFTIRPAEATSAVLTATSMEYTGSALKPKATVKADVNGKSIILKEGTDYTITYSNNVNAGKSTASATIKARGNYSGSFVRKFTITSKALEKKSVSLAKKAYTFTGNPVKPAVTVKDGSKVLKNKTDYTVSYEKNKNVGTATVIVKGKGNYKGTVKKTFKINPKGTRLSSLSAASKGFKAKWKKQTVQTTGYQIQCSTKKNFSTIDKKVTVKGKGKTSKKITGLKAKTKYYVRIRTYRTVGGKTYYSGWSALKTVTTGK